MCVAVDLKGRAVLVEDGDSWSRSECDGIGRVHSYLQDRSGDEECFAVDSIEGILDSAALLTRINLGRLVERDDGPARLGERLETIESTIAKSSFELRRSLRTASGIFSSCTGYRSACSPPLPASSLSGLSRW